MAKNSSGKDTFFLKPTNIILQGLLETRLIQKAEEACDSTFSEFDDVTYRVQVFKESLKVVHLSIAMRNFESFLNLAPGGMVYLDTLYEDPGCQRTATLPGFDLTFEIDSEKLVDSEKLIKRLCELKRNILAGPIESAINATLGGSSDMFKLARIQHRENESMWIKAEADRVYIIYDVAFTDPTDQLIAGSFLQEFQHSSQNVNGAPLTAFSADPPLELRGTEIQKHPTCVGYIRFAVQKQHLEDAQRRERTITQLLGFRNYLHHHIKASRTYLHMCMRRKINYLLQVLQRAVKNRAIEGASEKK